MYCKAVPLSPHIVYVKIIRNHCDITKDAKDVTRPPALIKQKYTLKAFGLSICGYPFNVNQ